MSLAMEIAAAMGVLPVGAITVNRESVHHGEKATEVTVRLKDGRTVTGTFTKEDREGFGGVDFQHRKDIPGLMRAKVESVLAGTAEV